MISIRKYRAVKCDLKYRRKPVFVHPALKESCDSVAVDESFIQLLLSNIKSVLIVDPNKIFLYLFRKSILSMMPHADIKTSQSSKDAREQIETAKKQNMSGKHRPTHGFDIIIIEEQLYPKNMNKALGNLPTSAPMQSGSNVILTIVREQRQMKVELDISSGNSKHSTHPQYSFLIGVSANIGDQVSKLKASGADLIWCKPPPSMNENLRFSLLEAVVQKRKQGTTIK